MVQGSQDNGRGWESGPNTCPAIWAVLQFEFVTSSVRICFRKPALALLAYLAVQGEGPAGQGEQGGNKAGS